MNYKFCILLLLSVVGMAVAQEKSMDLAGTWRLALDREDVGIGQSWFADKLPGDEQIDLPGSLQAQGFGDAPGMETPWVGQVQQEWDKPKYAPYKTNENFKMPFWLQPDRYYKGAAWYQTTITVPEDWNDQHMELTLGRSHWETQVWVDSNPAGSNRRLSVAHVYDLTPWLTPGEHTLTIRVDNRMIVDVGVNSHSVSDHTQSNWNGLIGKLQLTATDPVWIKDIQIYPDVTARRARVVVRVGNKTATPVAGTLSLGAASGDHHIPEKSVDVQIPAGGDSVEVELPMGKDVRLWDEFSPNLYRLNAALKTEVFSHEKEQRFGMREVSTKGSQFTINGRPVFLRGTLECAIFPITGYPPMEVDAWKRIIRICKAHGLNHMRFHSWCPPEAAFMAADELGFYFQVECASWANSGATVGDGKPLDQWLYDEGKAITQRYGNHPSFCLMAYGNEPSGAKFKDYLADWCTYWKKHEPRALHTPAAGWPMLPEADFHNTPGPRIQQWAQELDSIINSESPHTEFDWNWVVKNNPEKPVISHEIGEWCVYPNFDEMKKYTGLLKPKNFEIFQDFLEQKNQTAKAHDFLMASGKLQTLCYKADIETALRTDGFGGFQLLDLHDFPGQGTATVGVLDPFWDAKPYVSAAEYHRFCAPIVPLARLAKRSFVSSDTLAAQIEIAQFGPVDIRDAEVNWALLDGDGHAVRNGTLRQKELATGKLQRVGRVDAELAGLPAPAKYTLEVKVGGTDAVNGWDVWVYPDTVKIDSDPIRVVRKLDAETEAYLKQGGKVLWAIDPQFVQTDMQIGFSSIFWNTAWTHGQAPHTMGILCDPQHPALAQFPTEYHSNWQWSQLIQHSAAMVLDDLPSALQPIVQVVPDWFTPRKLALAFEAKVGAGALLVCSVDLIKENNSNLEQRQLRASLLAYMETAAFKPETELTVEQLKSLIKPYSIRIEAGTTHSGHPIRNLQDGKPETIWHSDWRKGSEQYPYEFVIELESPMTVTGLVCTPRLDGTNGTIKTYRISTRSGNGPWAFLQEGVLSDGVIAFETPTEAQEIRFEALSEINGTSACSIAELRPVSDL